MIAFPPTAALRGHGLELRRPIEADAAAILRIFSDHTDVLRFVGWRPRKTAEQARRFVRQLIAGWAEGRPGRAAR